MASGFGRRIFADGFRKARRPAPYGLPIQRGIGDRLKPSQWKFLQQGALHGFDGEQNFVRMTAMNAMLHGFDQSPIVRRDSICGSEEVVEEMRELLVRENGK